MDFDLSTYRVLVTGASGILGTRLSEQLLQGGAEVIGFDLDGMNEPFRLMSEQYKGVEMVCGNMQNISAVGKAVAMLGKGAGKKTAVFHFAAMSDANQCKERPNEAFEQNVVSTINLLEACSKKGIRRIIYPSTAYVYGANYKDPIKEDYAVSPSGIYALTKLLAEEVIRGYSNFMDLSCDNVRISNVYGPDSKASTILGTILFQAKTKGAIFLRDLQPVRDFIYIDDVIDGLIRVLLAGDEHGCRTYNLSTGLGTSVGKLACTFCEAEGLPPEAVKCDAPSGKMSVLVLSNDRLSKRIVWKPKYTVLEGIKKVLLELKEFKYAKT